MVVVTAVVVVFGAVPAAGETAVVVVVVVVLLVAGGAAAPGAIVEPAELASLPGVGVAVAAEREARAEEARACPDEGDHHSSFGSGE